MYSLGFPLDECRGGVTGKKHQRSPEIYTPRVAADSSHRSGVTLVPLQLQRTNSHEIPPTTINCEQAEIHAFQIVNIFERKTSDVHGCVLWKSMAGTMEEKKLAERAVEIPTF